MGKIRVLRGQLELNYPALNSGIYELIKDDSRFTHGYRIKRFVISWNNLYSPTAGSRDMYGVLAASEKALSRYTGAGYAITWDWDDKLQYAWASTDTPGDSYVHQTFELVDPTKIVVRELWVGVTIQGSAVDDRVNYYVELEEVELSENQAVLAIIKEEGQSVQS